ncbi:FK506-binding protein-like [Centropristis striata]|uniref:FK506-binding protein-like n=1 Tax=Centropristis striata TaxID=184440 RepID=UPI0027E17080|nr:FK506-binding protein-like [Centropristis striata]XP_059188716.1 FK506-binding protein-like [Centropristis striata]XP_059188717.1 FK506-binding protein-like [Centropristis striata]
MDPGQYFEELQGTEDDDGVGVTSWVSVCPRGLWKVQKKRTHKGNQQTVFNSGDGASCSSRYYPRLGSLCQVQVQLQANMDETESLGSEKGNEKLSVQPDQSVTEVTEAKATAFPRCQDSVLQVPLGDWTTLRLGEGQCDITEACVEGMRVGEKCEILISPVGPDVSVPRASEENLPFSATVELRAFTPGQESWQMPPGEKWQWVKSHKGRGGVRFRSGDVWGAADSYSRALKLLITLHVHVREEEKKGEEQDTEEQRDPDADDKTQQLPSANEFKTSKAELHSNLSLCQLKLNQPERAKASAAKATQLEPGGTKAWYRMGQACQMLNELEEARQAFRKLLELQPESPAALKALKDIARREKERNAQLGLRLSKMFS